MDRRPSDKLAIAVAQLNSTVGDVAGNAEKVRRARMTAAAQGADLVVFPELFIAGYPPEDLVLKPAFQAACRAAIEALARETASGGPAMLVGTPWLEAGKLYNAVALLEGGAIAALRYQGRSAELWRVRRKARIRAGADAGAGEFPRRATGTADLRGHLGRGNCRMSGRNRRRIAGGAERLALLAAEGRRAAQHRGGPRHRARTADGLCQPGRRPG